MNTINFGKKIIIAQTISNMRIIITSIFLVICVMINLLHAEILTLKGNTQYSNQYVPPTFNIKDSLDSYEIDNQIDGISELFNICKTGASPCEIVVDVKKTESDYLYKGIITSIESINGSKLSEINTKNNNNKKVFKNNKNEKPMLAKNTYDCNEFKLFPIPRSANFFDKRRFNDSYILPNNFDINEVILNDNFSVPFAHNFNEKVDFERKSDIYFEKYNNPNFGNIITINYLYKNYGKITIKDKNGNICSLTFKNYY